MERRNGASDDSGLHSEVVVSHLVGWSRRLGREIVLLLGHLGLMRPGMFFLCVAGGLWPVFRRRIADEVVAVLKADFVIHAHR
jgi:hypothetical protein